MKEHHRTATIFAGIYALVQGLTWSIFAICFCAIYGCLLDYPFQLPSADERKTSSYLLYLSYFKGSCRSTPGTPLAEAPSASRTYHWMIVYGIISALWIPTSVLIVVAAVNKIKGTYGACFYYPWIFIASLVQLVDLVATIIYSIDIQHTMTVLDYESFINNIENVSGTNGITVVPAVIMTAIFSRGILFWLINLILLGTVVQAARAVSKDPPSSTFVERGARLASRDHVSSRWIQMTDNPIALAGLPRVNQSNRPPSPFFSRNCVNPESPQSPVSEVPPPLVREPSLRRSMSASTVYDVYGKPTGETLPLDSSRHYPSNDGSGNGNINNQLPWSYVKPNDLNKKKQELTKGAAKPPIPVPDYTMHFPQKGRAILARSNSSSISPGPSSPSYRPHYEQRWNSRSNSRQYY